MSITLEARGFTLDILKRVYFVSQVDLSERQITGIVSTGEPELWRELVKLCKQHEVCVYKQEGLSDIEWLEFKSELQMIYKARAKGAN